MIKRKIDDLTHRVKDGRKIERHNPRKQKGDVLITSPKPWIETRLAELGKSKAALGRAIGVPGSRISEIISGGRNIQTTEIPEIARFLELPSNVVLLLTVNPELGDTMLTSLKMIRGVNVMGAAGAGLRPQDEKQRTYEIFTNLPKINPSTKIYGLEIADQSMEIVYPIGTTIICIPLGALGRDVRSGERVHVVRSVGDTIEDICREYQVDATGGRWLVPQSTDHRFTMKRAAGEADESFRIVGVVVSSNRPEPGW